MSQCESRAVSTVFFDYTDFVTWCDNREDILFRISAIALLRMYLDKNIKITYTLKR